MRETGGKNQASHLTRSRVRQVGLGFRTSFCHLLCMLEVGIQKGRVYFWKKEKEIFLTGRLCSF